MAAVEKFVLSEVQDAFGTLTPLSSTERPNVHAIRALENECITKATSIPHPRHPGMGYAGIFMNTGEFAMSDPNAWQDPPNPGATPDFATAGQNRFLNDNDRAQIKAQHAADLITWANADIVHRVIKTALGKAIPDKWKPNLGIGQRGYGNTSARDIFIDLYDRYGIVTPADLRSISENIYKPWNPASPIEEFILNIETQQVFATKAMRPWHTYQLIDAALSIIRDTRQFRDEMREWSKLYPDSAAVQWHQFKAWWIEAYAAWERDRVTMQGQGYHGMNHTQTQDDDDRSLASLTEALTSLSSQRTQQEMALQALVQEVASLKAQLSNHAVPQPPGPPTAINLPANNMPTPPMPPPMYPYQIPSYPGAPTYQPMPPPPPPAHANNMQMPPPPPPPVGYQQPTGIQQNTNYSGGSNRRGRGRGRGGRNNYGNNNYNNATQRNNPPHPIKYYNNWFYCSSCGFDTPHESPACTRQRPNHNATLTREMKIADMHLPPNQQRYPNASHAGHHKRFLPSQAAANGYPQYQRDT